MLFLLTMTQKRMRGSTMVPAMVSLSYPLRCEVLLRVVNEIKNMVLFTRLMSCLPEMLCLEKGTRRGALAEPRGVLLRVVQVEVVVVVVIVVVQLSSGRVPMEVNRWIAVRRQVLASRRCLHGRYPREGAIGGCGRVLLLLPGAEGPRKL